MAVFAKGKIMRGTTLITVRLMLLLVIELNIPVVVAQGVEQASQQCNTAKACNSQGWKLYEQKKLNDAIAAYRRAIGIDKNFVNAYINLGLALTDQNKLDEAINAYEKAVELDSGKANAHSGLGFAWYSKGKPYWEKAIEEYYKAIKIDPKYPWAYINLGIVFADQNKLEQAISAYRKAFKVLIDSPKTAETAHNLVTVHNNLGWLLQKQGRLNEALAEYEAALKIDPKYKYAKNNRDAVLALLKQTQQLAYTDTRYLRPDDPLTRPKRAVVLLTPIFRQGRNQQGTGFIIKRTDKKLWILTNRHVLTDTFYSNPPRTCDSVEVQIYPGDKPRDVRIAVLTSKIILIADGLDLALIELEASQLPADIQALTISNPSDNQPITTIGHPDKNPWQKDQGKVIDVDNEKLRLKISLAIGSSGSPVMTENYGVIGIIYKIDQEGTGYAIPINKIRKQLETWKVQLP
jgi:superkiller protein 3